MDSTYAPQSPDLSSFLTASPTQAQPSAAAAVAVPLSQPSSSYAPRSPNLSSFARPEYSQLPPQVQVHHRNLAFGGHPAAPHQQQQQQQYADPYAPFDPSFQQGGQAYPPIPNFPPAHNFGQQHTPAYPSQNLQQAYPPHSYPNQAFKNEPSFDSPANFAPIPPQYPQPAGNNTSYAQVPQDDMPPRAKRERGATIKSENGAESAFAGSSMGPSMGIDVKTKFPVARIKRIMQADEEVGKVAQVTPVAVSKALELFMISLVTKSTTLARNGNSKRITAQHLKKAIEADEQFDFLNDIVGKVVEGPDAGGKRVKEDDDSDEAEEGAKKKARGRKKKGGE